MRTHWPANIRPLLGALVLRGKLRYPGPVHSASLRDVGAKTGDWEIGPEKIPDLLGQLRDREVFLIVAPINGGEPVHLCGICRFGLSKPGEPCPEVCVDRGGERGGHRRTARG